MVPTMRTLPLVVSIVATLAFGCGHSPAVSANGSRSCHEVTIPEEAQVGGQTVHLNGMAVRDVTIFDVDVYVGALYLAHRTADATVVTDSEQPKRMVLRFIHEVTRDDIVNAWESGFINNAGTERLGLTSEIATFESFFGEVSEGDEMVFDYVPGTGLTYTHNETVRGTIPGSAFARAFFLVFVGPQPPSAALKAGLLGGACD